MSLTYSKSKVLILAFSVLALVLSTWSYTQAVGHEISVCVKRSGAMLAVGDGFRRADCGVNEQLLTINTQGPKGDTGEQGIQGLPGLNGSSGAVGPQGPIGATGLQGFTGPQGLQGTTGPVGADGANGAQGPAGIPGPQGVQGLTGPVGPSGPQGPAGGGSAALVFYTNTFDVRIPPNTEWGGITGEYARCNSGDLMTGGGAQVNFDDARILASRPASTFAWYAAASNQGPVEKMLTISVRCLDVTP